MPEDVTLENGAFRDAPFKEDLDAVESDLYKSSTYYRQLQQTDLSGNFREDVIAVAKSQIGYHEGDSEADYGGGNTDGSGDYSEYGRFLGSSGNAWCSEFASWCIRMAGVPSGLVNSSKGANAKTFTVDTSAAYHPWSETTWGGGSYTPDKGDVILWVWKTFSGTYAYDQSLSHTTLLERVEDDGDKLILHVVHGNSGGAVGTAEYTVDKANGQLTNGNGYVGYFVAPDYENSGVSRHTVTFNANGGTVGVSAKRVVAGGLYGPLPTPVKNGQQFLGWFNANGKRINMYSPCRSTSDETLKAKWQGESEALIPVRYLRPGASASSVKVYDKTKEPKELGANVYGQLYSYTAGGKSYVALYIYGTADNAVLDHQINNDDLYGEIAENTVTDIIMDDHITCIDSGYVFNEMKQVTNVRLSEALKEMEGGVFLDCESLPEIMIPKSLEEVYGDHTFEHCASLKKIIFEDGAQIIPDTLCSVSNHDKSGHIETVIIPPTVKVIGASAFAGQKDLTTVIFTDPAKTTLARIGGNAFYGTNLSGIILPKFGGTWFNSNARTNCPPEIGAGAFGYIKNTNFKVLIIPEGVKDLGQIAIGSNNHFIEIYLPKSLVNFSSAMTTIDDMSSLSKIYYAGSKADFYKKYGRTEADLKSYDNEWVEKMIFNTPAPTQVTSITAGKTAIAKYLDDTDGWTQTVELSIAPAKHLDDTVYTVKSDNESVATGKLSAEENGKMTLTLNIKNQIGRATVTVSGGLATTSVNVIVKEREQAIKPALKTVTGSGNAYGDLLALGTETKGAQIFYVTDKSASNTLLNNTGTVLSLDSATGKYKVKSAYEGQVREYTEPFMIGGDIISESGLKIHAVAVKKGLKPSGVLNADLPYASIDPWGEIDPEDRAGEFGNNINELAFSTDHAGVWIPQSQLKDPALVYTGKAVTIPDLRVYYGTKRLTMGTDYTLKYANNVNAGSNASITVTLKGNYAGTKVASPFLFRIAKCPLTSGTITYSAIEIKEKVSKGEKTAQKPDPKIVSTITGKTLKPGVDYALQYTNGKDAITEAGIYGIKVSNVESSNYEVASPMTIDGVVHCLGDTNIPMSKVTVTAIPTQNIAYWKDKGYVVEPEFTVSYKGTPLTEDTHYTKMFINNTAAGTASLVLRGKGPKYYGSKTVTFKIQGIPFTANHITITGIEDTYPFNGEARGTDYQVRYDGGLLTEGEDYSVSYAKNGNVNAGTVNMTFTGKGAFTGALKKSFRILPISGVTITDAAGNAWIDYTARARYTRNGVQPAFRFRVGGKALNLVSGKDYTVKYANNNAAAAYDAVKGKKKVGPSFTVTFKGNYSGKVTQYFTIEKQSISSLQMSVEDMVYVNAPGKYVRKPVITDQNGVVLKAGTDYKKDFIYTYDEDAVFTVTTGKGKNAVTQTISREKGDPVQSTDVVPAGAVIRVQVKGDNNYFGDLSTTFTVAEAGIANLKFSVPDPFQYTGRPITPGKDKIRLQRKVGGKFQNVEAADALVYYDIIGYSNNVKKGTGKIFVRAKNGYAGTATVTFRIVNP